MDLMYHIPSDESPLHSAPITKETVEDKNSVRSKNVNLHKIRGENRLEQDSDANAGGGTSRNGHPAREWWHILM